MSGNRLRSPGLTPARDAGSPAMLGLNRAAMPGDANRD